MVNYQIGFSVVCVIHRTEIAKEREIIIVAIIIGSHLAVHIIIVFDNTVKEAFHDIVGLESGLLLTRHQHSILIKIAISIIEYDATAMSAVGVAHIVLMIAGYRAVDKCSFRAFYTALHIAACPIKTGRIVIERAVVEFCSKNSRSWRNSNW